MASPALVVDTEQSKDKQEAGSETERSTSQLPSSISTTFTVRRNLRTVKHEIPVLTSSATRIDNGIEVLSYEETVAGKPPISVIRSPPRNPPNETHPALRTGLSEEHAWKRDSGLATDTSSNPGQGSFGGSTLEEKERELGLNIDFDSNNTVANITTPATLTKIPIAAALAADEGLRKSETRSSSVGDSRWKLLAKKSQTKNAGSVQDQYTLIDTPIPVESLIDEEALESIKFSKRGSLMMLGTGFGLGQARPNASRRQPSFSMLDHNSMKKLLPDDVELESQKVRSMYEKGSKLAWEDGEIGKIGSLSQKLSGSTTNLDEPKHESIYSDISSTIPPERPGSVLSIRNEHELAGGIEDWEDIEVENVDRYGFIERRSSLTGTPEPRIHKVATMLQIASQAPRKKRTWGRRRVTTSSAASQGTTQKKNRKVSARSVVSQDSTSSQRSNRGTMQRVSNRFPINKDKRSILQAGDMLTLPPGLSAIDEDREEGSVASALKKKEHERSEKWRKMAKVVKIGADGQGMEFKFDPRNAKLIERTWKGIPDIWRAAAWYSFLADSAAKRPDTVSDAELVDIFRNAQHRGSAEDLQIDLDVPRTIGNHVMFRKRYVGGQRLMFRVLHAFSLHFPKPGYIQGMASLAATLLCYYDEEKAFIMMVRMWTLRGIDKIFELEFKGLLAALGEFRHDWLAGREISNKLDDMGINNTDWGVRWYLTIFNYTIPFPAQLRVWDVFMLLGEIDPSEAATKYHPYQGGIDILHATSAALMDAIRESVMHEDTEFETLLKVLTGFIPIQDTEMFMNVVKAEYKLHRQAKKEILVNRVQEERELDQEARDEQARKERKLMEEMAKLG